MARLDAFFQLARQQGGSDIHITVGRPPLIRIDGDLTPIRYRSLSAEETESIIMEILDQPQREVLRTNGSVDISHSSPETGRFRISICRQLRGISAMCRVIPSMVFVWAVIIIGTSTARV